VLDKNKPWIVPVYPIGKFAIGYQINFIDPWSIFLYCSEPIIEEIHVSETGLRFVSFGILPVGFKQLLPLRVGRV
jgi:hypothetical protein